MSTPADRGSPRPFSFDEIAAAMLDEEGVVQQWSEAAAELLGRSATEVCGRPVEELLTEAPGKPCWSTLTGAGMPATGRASLRHRCGMTVEVAFRALPMGASSFLILAAPGRCVTDWEQGTALFRALFAQDQMALSLYDADLTLVRTNITPEMFCRSASQAGSQPAEAMSPEGAEAALRSVLDTGVPLVGREQQLNSPHDPGRQWSVSLSALRVEDTQGHPAGVAEICTDDTAGQRARSDLELLSRASVRIGASLDIQHITEEILDVLVPALGDVAWVDLAEAVLEGDEPSKIFGGGELYLRRAAVKSAAGDWPAALIQPGEAIPRYPDMPNLRRWQHGKTIIANSEALSSALGDPRTAALFVPEHGHTLIGAPMWARGLVLGGVSVWRTERPEPFDQHDMDLLAEIVSRAALSVDNARRYTREHRAAITLQQQLLPRATTETTAVQSVGFYRPAGGGAEISGDWFDVLPLPSLRTAVVVGDVIGHGLQASATMGRLRTAVQTLADLELEPGELLTRLDDLVIKLAAESDPARRDTVGAACLYAVYDPVTSRCTLASAGGPPPIVIRPDGTAAPAALDPGPPLGVGGLPFETTTFTLEPDSVLALYSDGLLHHGRRDPDQLAARLAELADRPMADIGRTLLTDAPDRPARDDAVLLLARTRPLPPDAMAEWTFPAEAVAVATAREAAAGQLAAWRLEELTFTTELAVSELVTNAARYASGPIGLRLLRNAAVLVCEVSDSSNTQPRLRRARTTDEGGRGLFLVAQLTNRWGCRYSHHSGKTIWAEQVLPAPIPVNR
ncbi:SpoIIE family protein phosphatase [Streptomyces sp. NPDC058175]|uniref:SpoIIE family protein phosphatase n=1 Tax=Streptomyces sp. NPDC058175 TaxID=3346367 RepID=UPI0036ED6F23